jgi:hypothetical protein
LDELHISLRGRLYLKSSNGTLRGTSEKFQHPLDDALDDAIQVN